MLKYVSKYIIAARFVVLYSIIRQVLTAPVPTTAPAPAAIIDQATLVSGLCLVYCFNLFFAV